MWSYYGRKTKVIKYYPKPIHDTIIEPFAGTAVYSLHENNWQKDVYLIEKYEVMVKIWHYLQAAKPEDILALPDMEKGESVDEHKHLCEEERWLIGFCINRGSANPKVTAKEFNSWDKNKVKIAEELHKIRHWKIKCDDYTQVKNVCATWYIDPPYQYGGEYYRHNKIDYGELADWCKGRMGQAIVCENTKATWLPFWGLKSMRGQKHATTEAIWTNISQQQAII